MLEELFEDEAEDIDPKELARLMEIKKRKEKQYQDAQVSPMEWLNEPSDHGEIILPENKGMQYEMRDAEGSEGSLWDGDITDIDAMDIPYGMPETIDDDETNPLEGLLGEEPKGMKVEKTKVAPKKGELEKTEVSVLGDEDEDVLGLFSDEDDISGKMTKNEPKGRDIISDWNDIIADEEGIEEDEIPWMLTGLGGLGLKQLGSKLGKALPKAASKESPKGPPDFVKSLWEKVGKQAKEAGGKDALSIKGVTKPAPGKLRMQYKDATNKTGAESSKAAKRFGGFGDMNRSDAMRAAERITNQTKKGAGANTESIKTQLRNLGLSEREIMEIMQKYLAP